jgi:hypothetical protein
MAGQLDPSWVPSATDIAFARLTPFAEFATRKCGYRGSSYLGLWQWSVANEAQALNPQAKSPPKISTTITSPGAAL